MGGAVSSGSDNDELIDNLKEAEYIKTSEVERVFRIVDRAHYYLAECRENAYKDLAWKSGTLHLSAPCIYSEVMEALELKPGLSFLNLGSGTGYLSTMVGLMIGPYGINHGIELHPENVAYANEKLESFIKYCKRFDELELCEPQFVVGNCLNLAPENRLYDRVYCGAACPPELKDSIQNMIKINGILVMPVGDQLLKIKKVSEKDFTGDSVLSVSFASLVQPNPNQKDTTPIMLPDVNPLSLQCMCRITIRDAIRSTFNFQLVTNVTSKSKKTKHIRTARLVNFNDDRYPLDILPANGGLMIMEAFASSEELSEDSTDSEDSEDNALQMHSVGDLLRAKERILRTKHLQETQEVDSDLSENEAGMDSQMKDVNGNKDSLMPDENAEADSCDVNTETASEKVDNGTNVSKHNLMTDDLGNESTSHARQNVGASRFNHFSCNNTYGRIADKIFNFLEPEDQLASTPIKASLSGNRSISQSSDDDAIVPKLVSKSQMIHMASSSTQPCPITASYSTSADTSETSGFGSLGDEASHQFSTPGSLKESKPSDMEHSEVNMSDEGYDLGLMDVDDDIHLRKSIEKTANDDKSDVKKCADGKIPVDNDSSESEFTSFLKEKVNSLPIPSTLKGFILYYR